MVHSFRIVFEKEGCAHVRTAQVWSRDPREADPLVISNYYVDENGLHFIDSDGVITLIDPCEGATAVYFTSNDFTTKLFPRETKK